MTDFLTSVALAFLFGGFVCSLVQILIDRTNLTPARILVLLVCLGVALYAVGAYEPLFERFGCGISLPLLGFGGAIGRGVRKAVAEEGWLGVLTGPFTAASAGCSAALLFGYLCALLFKGKRKSASKHP